MTHKTLLTVALLVLAGGHLFGQSGDLQGRVILKGSSEPLAGIHVYLEHTTWGAFSNQKGAFQLEDIPFGAYQLAASAIGYATIVMPLEWDGTDPQPLVIEMEESVMGLPMAVVQSVSLTGGLRGLRDVPGSAQYLSAQELEKFSYTDINRTLRTVAGVNLQEEDGFGLRPNIGLRGAGAERSSKITLMEDGVLAAPAPYASPAAYYFPTTGRMQAVEILKGSSQVRFGPFTTGGAINLISTAIPDRFSGHFDLMAGSYGSRNLHAFAGNSHKHLGYLVETFQYNSDGFKELDGGGETGFDKKDYLLKLRLNTGPKARMYQSLTFKIGESGEVSDETYLGLTQEDFRSEPYRRYAGSQKDQMETLQRQYSVQHLLQISSVVDLTTVAYRNEFHRNWYKLDQVAGANSEYVGIANILSKPEQYEEVYKILTGETSLSETALKVKANNRKYLAQGVQTVAGFRFGKGFVRHSLDIGLRYHCDEMDRYQWQDAYRMEAGFMELTDAGEPGTESNRILSARALAVYGQYKFKTGHWALIPGLRFEDIDLREMDFGKADPDRTGAQLKESRNRIQVYIPGIGIDYKLSESAHLFAGVHKGFSPPGAQDGANPEQSINYELGARYLHPGLSGQAVLFYNDYENLLGADLAAAGGQGSGDLFNGGRARTGGLEFQLTYDMLSGHPSGFRLPLGLVYTFTDASFQSSFASELEGWGAVEKGDDLPYLARHQLALTLGLEDERYGIHFSGRYQSPMRTQAGQGALPESERTDDFFVADVSASYRVHRNVSVFAMASNLFNETYIASRHPAGLRPSMPRTLMLGGKVHF